MLFNQSHTSLSIDANAISSFNIEFRNGYFELLRLMTPISRHSSLAEAQKRKNQEEHGLTTLYRLR